MQQIAITLTAVDDKLATFSREHRPTGRTPLERSAPYALYPQPPESPEQRENCWPHPFPNCETHGVYLILDAEQHVLYIGKASMTNRLGNRLATYFQWDKDRKGCHIVGNWSNCEPRFVATIPVDDALHFEAAALEEYLIAQLNPPLNTRGRKAFS